MEEEAGAGASVPGKRVPKIHLKDYQQRPCAKPSMGAPGFSRLCRRQAYKSFILAKSLESYLGMKPGALTVVPRLHVQLNKNDTHF